MPIARFTIHVHPTDNSPLTPHHSTLTMIDLVIESRKASISASMQVKRILPFRLRRMVGPFIFMDHAGPVAQAPADQSLDVLK